MDKLFSIEHGKVRYWADFALYGLAIMLLMGFLILNADGVNALGIVLVALLYVLHRHILHGVQPFKRWHLLHHERPHGQRANRRASGRLSWLCLGASRRASLAV
jgi:hypothetical protein